MSADTHWKSTKKLRK